MQHYLFRGCYLYSTASAFDLDLIAGQCMQVTILGVQLDLAVSRFELHARGLCQDADRVLGHRREVPAGAEVEVPTSHDSHTFATG
ncbi:hypothetical protein D3C76_1458220 [compost metagenome]